MSLFGNMTAGTGGSLFNTSTTTTTANATPSLFGTAPAAAPAPAQKSLFGTTTTAQPATTGLFGQSQAAAQPATNGLFGTSQTQPQFNASSTGLLGQSQQPQRPLNETLRFGTTTDKQTVAQAQDAKEPWWKEGRGMGVYRSIPEQIQLLQQKWDAAYLTSPLRTYLYQHVQSATEALKYTPGPLDDATKWEDAVENRPGPEWVPVVARGFRELGARAEAQVTAIGRCYMMLNEINTSLDIQLDAHRTTVAARLEQAQRRHKVIAQRTLSLAVKVQTLKNRGYVMDNAEEELKSRLTKLESEVLDPTVQAREQEIWARMLGISERVRRLKRDMEKTHTQPQADQKILTDDETASAKKILTSYDTQLQHLQKELKLVQDEFADWAKFGTDDKDST